MITRTISTKEIRNDLEGFLRKLREGQTVQVMYRSKPFVTVAAKPQADIFTASDAGSAAAGRRSADFARNLPTRQPVFDSTKSFKELYDETKSL